MLLNNQPITRQLFHLCIGNGEALPLSGGTSTVRTERPVSSPAPNIIFIACRQDYG